MSDTEKSAIEQVHWRGEKISRDFEENLTLTHKSPALFRTRPANGSPSRAVPEVSRLRSDMLWGNEDPLFPGNLRFGRGDSSV